MANRYEQFDVNGGYTSNNFFRDFNGNFRVFPDGKLIGLTYEEEIDAFTNLEQSRIIVGLANQNNRMNFWKVSENRILPPLVSTLKEVQNSRYEGVWSPVAISTDNLIEGFSGLPGLTQVGETFDLEGIEAKLDMLSDIPKEVIQCYLNPNMIHNILNRGQYSIYLSLTKK